MADTTDVNTQIIEEFRANQGVVGGPFEGMPLLLLTTVGAKSGKARVVPVACREEGDRLYVFASKAGAPTNPDWYHNLVAEPEVTVEFGAETFDGLATVLTGSERDRVWSVQAEQYPGFAEYQASTDRAIPVVAIDRT
jgi:deazaflavin-dependent oxidoreductase (nitroreductase family)